ncbi:MAG: alternative ribosome rescue aminoacyl-tRNA hydrolase ArfB [Wenzhouxiangella sp.]|jgi:ribosome-associated protein|nr:alternative ribosome rescue aminoacyl-tRNA hydrolase ArfB [Wenzhouxiangella sp.]
MSSFPQSRFLPPESELSERFILTGGPGGQHVNRTETGVQLSFDVAGSSFLDPATKTRLINLAGRRIDSEGVLTIEAKSHRSQRRNREDARARLGELIKQASQPPRRRIPTRPTRTAKRKRLEAKRQRGQIKRARGKPNLQD